MIDDRQIIETLRDDRYAARTLDPERVIAGARRRRTRNRITTGLASAAVAAVAVTGFVAAGGLGGATHTSKQPPVAGSGGPSATATGHTTSVPVRPGSTGSWVPDGPVGAKPIGTIPRSGRVQLFDGYWFETKGTSWCITERDGDGNIFQPFSCRGTVGNSNIVPALSNMQSSGEYTSSVFKGDARRVLYTVDNKYYEAKLYRLAAVPGWMVAVVRIPSSTTVQRDPVRDNRAVFGYDGDGGLIGRFPDATAGGPATDPLHP